jgi:hypothetical protein
MQATLHLTAFVIKELIFRILSVITFNLSLFLFTIIGGHYYITYCIIELLSSEFRVRVLRLLPKSVKPKVGT